MSIIKKIGKKAVFSLPSSYVLMFHHVTSTPEIKCSGCLLDTDKFYKQIDLYKNYDHLKNVIAKPGMRKTAVTFDDGLEDLYTIAYPYLKAKGFPFTAFIVTDFLDKPGYITTNHLIEMSKDKLVTIGSHGITHRILPQLSAEEQQIEIQESKKILEDIINKEVFCFAYSHGQFNKDSLRYASIYDYCMSVAGYPLNFITKRNRLLIPRYNLENATVDKLTK